MKVNFSSLDSLSTAGVLIAVILRYYRGAIEGLIVLHTGLEISMNEGFHFSIAGYFVF